MAPLSLISNKEANGAYDIRPSARRFFCAIAHDENRTPYYMPGWHYSDQRLFELEKPKLLLMGGFALATRVKFSKQVNM